MTRCFFLIRSLVTGLWLCFLLAPALIGCDGRSKSTGNGSPSRQEPKDKEPNKKEPIKPPKPDPG
jgi:hypothetical protein